MDSALVLFPMLDAVVAADAGMGADRWRALGRIVRRLHEVPPPAAAELPVPVETFQAWRRDLIEPIAETAAHPGRDPISGRFATVWRDHREEIGALVALTDSTAERLRGRPAACVLCHTDLHTWNVLVDADGRLWIVDWEEAMLAPRERDLMFAIGGGLGRGLVSADDTAAFLQGYGQTTVDEELLAYYRIARALEDIAACGEEIALMPGADPRERERALRGLEALFEPGAIVELALSEAR